MARRCKCRWCKKSLTTGVAKKVVIKNKNMYFCNEEHVKLYFQKQKETSRENKEFEKLCDYIHDNIFQYTKEQLLPKSLFSRLQDLRNGTVVLKGVGRVEKSKEGYPYQVILRTFEEMNDRILWCFKNKKGLQNERSKIAYMMAIIENQINDVYTKHKSEQRAEAIANANKSHIDEASIIAANTTKHKARPKKSTILADFLDDDELL